MAGVYKLFNKVNGNFYIGSTVQEFKKRINKHFRDMKNKNHNKLIMQDFYEHGLESFDYEVLEECFKEDCLIREQKYIDELKPFYNVAKKALNTFGIEYKQSTKDNISKYMKNYYDSEINNRKLLFDTNSMFIYKILNINNGEIYFEQSLKRFCEINNLNVGALCVTTPINRIGKVSIHHKCFKVIDKVLIDDFIKEYFEYKIYKS